MREHYYIGVDVGTGSARAGLFDAVGNLLAAASHPIQTFRPQTDFVEQSSEDIWQAVCRCVRDAIGQTDIDTANVHGIGFAATCSLVVLDEENRPVTVSSSGDDAQNIIVWMDHRAVNQAERINRLGHTVLKYVGHVISPEMQTPKLLWLKEEMSVTWRRARRFFDLPDFLTFRATGDETRSLCSTVCKWTYLGHVLAEEETQLGRWDDTYFRTIGLEDLAEEGFARIGQHVRAMGQPLGRGVTAEAAVDLGIPEGTAVGVSIIDAHAGGIGMIGAKLDGVMPQGNAFDRRLALIGGTSSCHMASSTDPRFIRGIWGPYYSSMIPGLWLTEGGQSATGALIDFIIENHGATDELRRLGESQGLSPYEVLNRRLENLAQGNSVPASLTRQLHVCPYFHGNRSPWADPTLRGMICGLSLSATLDDLAVLYLATIQAIAYGTRHIIEVMNLGGYRIDTIFACGGGTKNSVFLREHADITGCQIILPREPESVLLGSAMLGAIAAGEYANLNTAMACMSGPGKIILPSKTPASYHQSKYAIFQRLHTEQQGHQELMQTWGSNSA